MKLMKQKAVWLMAMLLFSVLSSGECLGNAGGDACSKTYPRMVSLNGVWEFQGISEMSSGRIDPEGWVKIEIPAMGVLKEGHFGAYRKRFEKPVIAEKERVFVHFQGVAFACEVYLNGQMMGRHGPTLEPFEVELTPYLGAENELVVLVQDWSSGVRAEVGGRISEVRSQKSEVGGQRSGEKGRNGGEGEG